MFEQMLTGGHPNSLGKTIEVVNMVLENKSKFEELFQCYFSNDPVVRLRVSNAMKRICKEQPRWLVPYLDRFLNEIGIIDQPSTQWTLATLFLWLDKDMTADQKEKSIRTLKQNLDQSGDWIVQNTTMETLGIWAKSNLKLKLWLLPKLEEFTRSPRKSVAGRAKKILKTLE